MTWIFSGFDAPFGSRSTKSVLKIHNYLRTKKIWKDLSSWTATGQVLFFGFGRALQVCHLLNPYPSILQNDNRIMHNSICLSPKRKHVKNDITKRQETYICIFSRRISRKNPKVKFPQCLFLKPPIGASFGLRLVPAANVCGGERGVGGWGGVRRTIEGYFV